MHNPDTIILMETRVNSSRAQQIIHNLDFLIISRFHRKRFSGGIWLLWLDKDTTNIEIIQNNNRFFHWKIQDRLIMSPDLESSFPDIHNKMFRNIFGNKYAQSNTDLFPWFIMGYLKTVPSK